MANDQHDDGDEKSPQDKVCLSKETVEQAKNTILHGIGYRRPPQHTRFQKGQSGNPKGRPKSRDLGLGSSRSANALALKEGERLIAVREGEEVRKIPTIEVVLRSQLKSATSGSAYAQKHFIQRYDWAEREKRQQIMEEIEFWKVYIAAQRELIEHAQTAGQPAPSPLPHPDDVIIDYENGVRFIGPICDEDVARMEENLKVRDVLLLQNALDRREVGNPESEDPLDGPGTAMVFALILNQSAPERFRLSDNQILLKVMRYDAMPKRALLKYLYRSWRAIGVPALRGRTLPPLRGAKQVLEQTNEVLSQTSTDT